MEEEKKEIVEENYKIATEKLDCYKNYINRGYIYTILQMCE